VTINRRSQNSPFAPGRKTKVKRFSNFALPWACIRLPERSSRLPPSGARRMLVKLGELHRPLHSCPTRNPGATWGSTCLDRPFERSHEVMLEVTMLH
jgi:hypothetical protein